MKLESNGILINIRPFNERDAIARVFSHDYGIISGMMRGAIVAKKNRPLVGQVGSVVWNARLDSQLGIFHWEAEKNLAVPIMAFQQRLACMNAAFDLLNTLLPEREEYMTLFDETMILLNALGQGDAKAYLTWELNLLRDLGYALDCTKCSGCGTRYGLTHLSPRTGRAVCADCARPYINKLYSLPVNLNVTLRFLESICMQQGTQIPNMRRMLKIV